jgi:hypothetical protein
MSRLFLKQFYIPVGKSADFDSVTLTAKGDKKIFTLETRVYAA